MLNLTISDDWQQFIEGKLRAGQFASAEEVVGEGLRALKEVFGAPSR
jgi:Arc/MetJ-type ribon-helix-helix transcriptional regulator